MAPEIALQASGTLDSDDPWGLALDQKPAVRASRPIPAERAAAGVRGRAPAAAAPAPAKAATPVAAPRAIPSEASVASAPAVPVPVAAGPVPRISAILTALALSGVLVWAGWMAGTSWAPGAQAAQTIAPVDAGRLVVSSHPPGGVVTLDGRTLGSTPVAIDFRPGPVSVVVTSPDGHAAETIDATIAAGVTLARHLTWPARVE